MKGGFYIHTTTLNISPVLLQLSSEATSHTLSAIRSHKEETNIRLGGEGTDGTYFRYFVQHMCTHVYELKGKKTTQNTPLCWKRALWLTSGAE